MGIEASHVVQVELFDGGGMAEDIPNLVLQASANVEGWPGESP
jgi:hypothetical protein